VQGAATLLARLGRFPDPRAYLAVGDAKAILARLAEYREAGASKFVLRPIAGGDDGWMAQGGGLIAGGLPAVPRRAARGGTEGPARKTYAMRRPRPAPSRSARSGR